MNTVEEIQNKAVAMHQQKGKKTKLVLEELLGKDVFVLSITDRIKTFQDALDYNGEKLCQFVERTQFDSDSQKAHKQLEVIALALNEGKTMTYADTNEGKYYPWFRAAGSASGFSFIGYGCDRSYSGVGARLTFKTKELAIYAGKQFTSIYNQYING